MQRRPAIARDPPVQVRQHTADVRHDQVQVRGRVEHSALDQPQRVEAGVVQEAERHHQRRAVDEGAVQRDAWVHVQRHPERRDMLEYRPELRRVERLARDVREQLDAPEAQGVDAAVGLGDRPRRIAKSQCAEADELVRVVRQDSGQVVVDVLRPVVGLGATQDLGPGTLTLSTVRSMPIASMSRSFTSMSTMFGKVGRCQPVAHWTTYTPPSSTVRGMLARPCRCFVNSRSMKCECTSMRIALLSRRGLAVASGRRQKAV